MKGNKTITNVISAVFAFILFLSFSVLWLSIGSSLTFFSTGHLKSSLEKSVFADKTVSQLEKHLQKEAETCGLPEGFLKQQLDQDAYKKHLLENIVAEASGKEPDTEQFSRQWQEQIAEAADQYRKEKQIGDNDLVDQAVEELTANAAAYYNNYLKLPFVSYFYQYREAASGWIRILIPVAVILAALLIFFLVRIQHRPYRGWFYITGSLLASGILQLLAGALVSRGPEYRLSPDMDAYEAFLKQFIQGSAPVFVILGAAMVILAVIGFVILGNQEKHVKRKHIE